MDERTDIIKRHEERTAYLRQSKLQKRQPNYTPLQSRRGAWLLVIGLLLIAAAGAIWLATHPPTHTIETIYVVRPAPIPERDFFGIWLGCATAKIALDPDNGVPYDCYESVRYAVENFPDPYVTFWSPEWSDWWQANRLDGERTNNEPRERFSEPAPPQAGGA